MPWEIAIPVGLALFAVGFRWDNMLRKIRADNISLLTMHEHPEATGFGSAVDRTMIETLNANVLENTRAFESMQRWVEWLTEKQGHEPPPPKVGD